MAGIQRLTTGIGGVAPETIVKAMLKSEDHWHRVSSYAEGVLIKKKREQVNNHLN